MTPKRRVLNILVTAINVQKKEIQNLEDAVLCSKKRKNVPLENSPGCLKDLAEEIWKLNNHDHPRKKRFSAAFKVKVNEMMISSSFSQSSNFKLFWLY